MIANLRTWLGLKHDRRGVTALEYGMIAALIAAVIVGVVSQLGTTINTKLTAVASFHNSARRSTQS